MKPFLPQRKLYFPSTANQLLISKNLSTLTHRQSNRKNYDPYKIYIDVVLTHIYILVTSHSKEISFQGSDTNRYAYSVSL